jgi:DNA helicase-2/ATP-dependent DNA helicase PcrA
MEDGILPHSRSLESGDPEDMDEERRLCYVGITRAKRRLYLVHAFKRGLWGSSEVQNPSRFLEEIPATLLSGMVDKRARRESSFKRATTWDSDDDESPRRGRRTVSASWESTPRTPRSDAPESTRSTYWSPGGEAKSGPKKAATRASKAKPAGNLQFNRRDSVQHAKFGVGTVIESNLVGGEEEVTVAFPGVGIKRLVAALAGLKKL